MNDAFPGVSPLSDKAANALKNGQTALGVWHDHYQWGLKGAEEADLKPLLGGWAASEEQTLLATEQALQKLANALSKEDTTK